MTFQGFRNFALKLAFLDHTDIFRQETGITYFPFLHLTPSLRRIEREKFGAGCKLVLLVGYRTQKFEPGQIPLNIMI